MAEYLRKLHLIVYLYFSLIVHHWVTYTGFIILFFSFRKHGWLKYWVMWAEWGLWLILCDRFGKLFQLCYDGQLLAWLFINWFLVQGVNLILLRLCYVCWIEPIFILLHIHILLIILLWWLESVLILNIIYL